jgi:hypothetical protein
MILSETAAEPIGPFSKRLGREMKATIIPPAIDAPARKPQSCF